MPPTTPSTTQPYVPSAAPRSRGRVSRILVISVVIAALAALLAIFFWTRSASQAFPGSLIVRLPGAWTSPNGEMLAGTISYAPKDAAYFLEYGPALEDVRIITPLPGGTAAIGERTDGDSTELVTVDRLAQRISSVLARVGAGERVAYPVLSVDKETVAYMFVPAATAGQITDSTGNRYEVQPGDDPLLRIEAGINLPAALLPQLRVAQAGGDIRFDIPGLRPLAFSRNGAQLLAQGSEGLVIVSLDTGEQLPVAGDLVVRDFGALRASHGGNVLLMPDSLTGTATAYAFDWAGARVTSLGTIPAGTSFLLGNGDLALHDSAAGTLTMYVVRDGQLLERGPYAVALPSEAEILEWNP